LPYINSHSECLEELAKYRELLELYDQALELFKPIGSFKLLASLAENIANTLNFQSMREEAVQYIDDFLKDTKNLNQDVENIIMLSIRKAVFYLDMKEYEKSEKILKKCLSIAKEQGLSESKIYSELLSMFYASGQTSKSDEIESIVLDENKPEYLRELNIRSHYLLSNSATFDSTMSKCFTISVRVRPLYIEEDTVNISRLERGSSLEFEFDTEDNSVVNKIHYKYEKKIGEPSINYCKIGASTKYETKFNC